MGVSRRLTRSVPKPDGASRGWHFVFAPGLQRSLFEMALEKFRYTLRTDNADDVIIQIDDRHMSIATQSHDRKCGNRRIRFIDVDRFRRHDFRNREIFDLIIFQHDLGQHIALRKHAEQLVFFRYEQTSDMVRGQILYGFMNGSRGGNLRKRLVPNDSQFFLDQRCSSASLYSWGS